MHDQVYLERRDETIIIPVCMWMSVAIPLSYVHPHRVNVLLSSVTQSATGKASCRALGMPKKLEDMSIITIEEEMAPYKIKKPAQQMQAKELN